MVVWTQLQVTPAKSSGLLAERGFTCGCHIAKMSSGGCLLLPQPVLGSNSSSGVTSSSRSMTNVVTGPARTAMINSMSVAFKDQQLRQSLQVRGKGETGVVSVCASAIQLS